MLAATRATMGLWNAPNARRITVPTGSRLHRSGVTVSPAGGVASNATISVGRSGCHGRTVTRNIHRFAFATSVTVAMDNAGSDGWGPTATAGPTTRGHLPHVLQLGASLWLMK